MLAGPLHLASHFPPGEHGLLFGTIDDVRAVTAEQAYLTAFFQATLRHQGEPLLRQPSPGYPEVIFQP